MTQPLDVVQQPAFAVPPHVVDESGAIVGWFTEPAGVVLQLTRPTRGTTELAKWLVGPGYTQIIRRFPDTRDVYVVLDMRQMTGRAATARSLLIEHAKLIAKQLGTVVVLPSVHLGALYVKVIEATALMLRPFGVRIEIEHDLQRVLIDGRLRVASALDVDHGPASTRNGTGRIQSDARS
jgi:hypothetical protein